MDEKDSLTGEHQELTKQRAKHELNIKDLQQELEGDSSGKVSEVLPYVNASAVYALALVHLFVTVYESTFEPSHYTVLELLFLAVLKPTC